MCPPPICVPVSMYVLDAIFRYGFRWFSWQEKHTKSYILRPRIFMYEKIYLPLRVNWTWPSAGQNREVKFIPWDHNFVDISAYCRLLYQQWRDRIREGLNWKKKCKISHFWAVGKFLHFDIQIVQPSRWVGTPSPTWYVAVLEN